MAQLRLTPMIHWSIGILMSLIFFFFKKKDKPTLLRKKITSQKSTNSKLSTIIFSFRFLLITDFDYYYYFPFIHSSSSSSARSKYLSCASRSIVPKSSYRSLASIVEQSNSLVSSPNSHLSMCYLLLCQKKKELKNLSIFFECVRKKNEIEKRNLSFMISVN